MKILKPPEYLSRASKKLWAQVTKDYVLEPHHIVLLTNLCTQLDRAAAAREVIQREGEFIRNRFDVLAPNPALCVERQAMDLARKFQRELGLDYDGGPAAMEMPRPVGTERY